MIKVFQHDRVKTKRTTMSMMIEFTICVALVFIAALVYYGVSGGDDGADHDAGYGVGRWSNRHCTAWISCYAKWRVAGRRRRDRN